MRGQFCAPYGVLGSCSMAYTGCGFTVGTTGRPWLSQGSAFGLTGRLAFWTLPVHVTMAAATSSTSVSPMPSGLGMNSLTLFDGNGVSLLLATGPSRTSAKDTRAACAGFVERAIV